MQISSLFLVALGATAVAAADSTGTKTGASATQTGSSSGSKGSSSGSKATGTSSSKSTRTSGIVMSTGAANSLLGSKREMVTVAGLGVAFAVFM